MAFWIEDIKNDLGITVHHGRARHEVWCCAVSDRVLAVNYGTGRSAMGTPARGAVATPRSSRPTSGDERRT
jgi:hypothetical protein